MEVTTFNWKKFLTVLVLILTVACIIILILYAYEDTHGWMVQNVSPSINAVTGGVVTTIYESVPVQWLVANPAWSHLIVGLLFVCPISFPLVHSLFNKYRTVWVKSAAKESGIGFLNTPTGGTISSPVTATSRPDTTQPVPTPIVEPKQEATT